MNAIVSSLQIHLLLVRNKCNLLKPTYKTGFD